MLPLDPQADIGRRAWVACPNCDDRRGCATCEQGRTCSEHWRYLLSHVGSLLHLQCRSCSHIWAHETHFGATRSRWSASPAACDACDHQWRRRPWPVRPDGGSAPAFG